MKRFIHAGVPAMLCALVLGSCGGGGDTADECTQSGTIQVSYTPGRWEYPFSNYLYYKLGQVNTWDMDVSGVSSACLQDITVIIPPQGGALPAGFTLDAKTGRITSGGVMTKHIEGWCYEPGKTSSSVLSVNRVCPTGTSLNDVPVLNIVVSGPKFNTSGMGRYGIGFSPAP